jgi:hypothetical protein
MLSACLSALPAHAAQQGQYQAFWSGLPIAKFSLSETPGKQATRLGGYIKTRGLVQWLAPFTNEASATISCDAQKQCTPGGFEGTTHIDGKTKRAIIQYSEAGKLPTRIEDPKHPNDDPPGQRTMPTPAQRRGAVDGLTFLYQLRQDIPKIGEPAKHWKLFDSKRLYEVTVTASDLACPLKGCPPARAVELRVKAIAGFSEKENKRWNSKPMAPATLWFTDDTAATPLILRSHVMGGLFTIRPVEN